MGAPVTTRYLAEDEYPEWTGMVAGSPDGSVYSLPSYLDALCTATGGSYRVLAAVRDGRLVGGVALYRQKSALGTCVSPRLLLYYNGIVLERHAARTPSQRSDWSLHALGALEQALAGLRYGRLRIKSRSTLGDLRPFASHGWTLQPTWSYVLNIADLPTAWLRIHKDQRRLIKRCRERGLYLSVDDDFDAFHRLHRETHQRKGAPLYLPREAFRRFVGTLQDNHLARLYHAHLPDGSVVASQLVLTGPHPVTHTVCCATDAASLATGASAFLRWSVCEHLSDAGYKANDLTDAELSPVTRFKSQLGGKLVLNLEVMRPDRMAFRADRAARQLSVRARRRILRTLRARRGKAR
ncbi:MAG: GNAT family N-acetyltransferase [Gammaproteobacteria bacterium]|nr:GNAT family N-acetyltransferase [Gammaproteobacteria bacterium]